MNTPRKPAAVSQTNVAYAGVAKHFWNELGRDGGVQFASAVPGVTEATADNKTLTIRISGTKAALKTASAGLVKLWADANAALPEWKKADKKYSRLNRSVDEERIKRSAMERDFLRDFAARAVRAVSA